MNNEQKSGLEPRHSAEMETIAKSIVQPTYAYDAEVKQVKVSLSGGMRQLVQAVADRIESSIHKPYPGKLFEDLLLMIDGVVRIRIAYVNRKVRKAPRTLGLNPQNIAYPSIFDPFIASIGMVSIKDQCVEIEPVPVDEWSDEQWQEWFVTYQRVRPYCDAAKLKMNEAMPKSPEGDVQVMAFQVVDDVLKHAQLVPEVKALISCVFDFSDIGTIFGAYRVSYGNISAVRNGCTQLARYA